MHFSWVCAVVDPENDVYSFMAPYQESEDNADYEIVDFTPFRDWYEIWWRWAWLIKLKKDHECSLPKYTTKNLHTSVAKKKDIEYFYEWKTDKDSYPQTRMFFDDNGIPHFQPDDLVWDSENKKAIENPDIKEDLKKYNDDLEKWYDKVPEDYYIVIIDYHD